MTDIPFERATTPIWKSLLVAPSGSAGPLGPVTLMTHKPVIFQETCGEAGPNFDGLLLGAQQCKAVQYLSTSRLINELHIAAWSGL